MMKIGAFVLPLLIGIVSIDGQQIPRTAGCYEHFPETDTWYKLHRMPVPFHEAVITCSIEGGILASPLCKQHELAMMTMIERHGLYNPIFTGIHATFSPGHFASLEGMPICNITTTWAHNEPDNFEGKENCIVMTPEGKLADVECNDSFSYLCVRTDNQFSICGTHDQGYEFNHRTGSCYKFHNEAKLWREAFMSCQAEGGHLAVINNSTESEVLKDLYAKYPEHTIKKSKNYINNFALIGFHDHFAEGHFMTVHGETLDKAGFSQFCTGQPDNYAPGENCGSIFRNGLLNDLWCTKTAAYICEITPGRSSCSSEV